jgi:heme-degrading monooxygenase HmoA
MSTTRDGQIAVIFTSVRTGEDESGYQAAAAAMNALAARQSGYCGSVSARNADGFGITVSYWDSIENAAAWRDEPEHARVREKGRGRWYVSYTLDIAPIQRSYDWTRHD